MLQQICEHIHNYFIKDRYESVYEIAEGMISLPLLEGQRFLIVGSVLNDGMYTYHDTGIKDDDDQAFATGAGLQDETWTGTICALAVPPAVIALSAEIKAWVDEYGEAVNSPFQSESVLGVYSYNKASGNGGSGVGGSATWQDMFRSQLNRWRKICL